MSLPNVLMVGTGEYTTGYVHGDAAKSDKGAGVVALTMFDLRRRRKIADLLMAGRSGTKFPGIREHLNRRISARYRDMDVRFKSYPADNVIKSHTAYQQSGLACHWALVRGLPRGRFGGRETKRPEFIPRDCLRRSNR